MQQTPEENAQQLKAYSLELGFTSIFLDKITGGLAAFKHTLTKDKVICFENIMVFDTSSVIKQEFSGNTPRSIADCNITELKHMKRLLKQQSLNPQLEFLLGVVKLLIKQFEIEEASANKSCFHRVLIDT